MRASTINGSGAKHLTITVRAYTSTSTLKITEYHRLMALGNYCFMTLYSDQMRERWHQATFDGGIVVVILGFGQIDDLQEGLDDSGIELRSSIGA